MALFTAKSRPRLTRSSTSSIKKKEREKHMFMYLLALVLLLVVSFIVVQSSLGRSSAHTAQDAKHGRKVASGAENLRVGRQKGESRISLVRQEKYKETKEANRKKLAEMFNLSKDWKTRSASRMGVGNRWIEGEEGGSKGKGVHYFSDVEGREINLNDEVVEELESGSAEVELNGVQVYTDKARMFEGQQLGDMDHFDDDDVMGIAYKRQGQLLEDMDKFDNHQVTEDTIKHQFEDDTGPKFMQDKFIKDLKRNRKMAGRIRSEKQAEGSSLVSEDDIRGHLQDAKKESRRLGFRGDTGRDVPNKGREGEEQESFDKKVGGSFGGQLGLENGSLSADTIKRTYEANKGSIRAAIKQAMEERLGVFSGEYSIDDTVRRNLWEKNSDPSFSHVTSSAEKTNLVKSFETGKPPLRGFKEFSENMGFSQNNEPLDINVLQMDVKRFDEGTSQVRRLDPPDIQKEEAGIGVSLDLLNAKENKGDIMESSRSAQETAEVHNSDSTNALAIEERSSKSKDFYRDENSKMNAEVSESEERLESADVMQSDKHLIKEDQIDNVEDIRDEVEEKRKSRKNNDDSAVEENGAEEESESGKTNEDDSAVEEKEDDDHDNMMQWGFYPTISSNLKFSKFLSAFFKQESCSLRIFMAWTTAPWAYTPRHQRAIESILHFHPQACIVVFTETIDFEFFRSWIKEGYKIAVARPNLEELLGKTPAIDFAYVWYEWRNTNLFYIHYTELLRIAALHKYGGVWLDMDMILARPLPKLHNVVGSTVSDSGEWVLNGAFMSFDKSSPFLKACIEEFVATYDETLLGWNGADLLNRVASNATKKGGNSWLEESEYLQVLEPIAFFPLSRHNITRYFSAPKNNQEMVEQKSVFSAILDESHGTHLWNSVTGRHVPEVGSLVDKILKQNCMRCTDIL